MAGLIRRNDIDEVRSRVDISEVVGEYVTLKNAGVGSMKGLCPFHDERSPSFHVRPHAGYYHCFGCGEGGDVFAFVQKMDHLTFTEAVERLAQRISYELHYEDGAQTSEHGTRVRILAANSAACDFFVKQLETQEAESARNFLGERGFDAAAAHSFGVGYAPQGWDNLEKHLRAQGFTNEELIAAGLLSSGDRGSYDRFRGRLIWPIRDQTGQTLGFGARRLFEDDKGPKYLNTSETLVYRKSQVLYGLDKAKREIARSRRVVVVEGYTDVMACHLAGVQTAVATCGTAFGVEHIKIMRRILGDDTAGLGEVIFTFDPDAAGQKAALKAFSEEQRFAAQTYVAVASSGLDPCDLRLAHGDVAVQHLVESKKPMFEFVIRQRLSRYDLNTVEGRAAALREAAPVITGIRDSALQPGYTRELARLLGVEIAEVERVVNSNNRAAKSVEEKVDRSPRTETISLAQLPGTTATRLERDVMMAVLQYPQVIGTPVMRQLADVQVTTPALAAVRDAIVLLCDDCARPDWVSLITAAISPEYRTLVEQLAVASIPERTDRELDSYLKLVVSSLIERDLMARKKKLLGELQRTDAQLFPEQYRDLQRTLMHLEEARRAIHPE